MFGAVAKRLTLRPWVMGQFLYENNICIYRVFRLWVYLLLRYSIYLYYISIANKPTTQEKRPRVF